MEDEVKTSDTALVVALTTIGLPPKEVEVQGKRCYFVYTDPVRFSVLQDLYLQNRLFVDAKTYRDNEKYIQSKIRDAVGE